MLLSDVGEAWEVGKPQRKALFILFQACSQALGESEHHGDHLQYSWVYGAGEGLGGFPGSSIGRHRGLGGICPGPGRQLASCNPAISRQRSWMVVLGGGADCCSWFLGDVSASHCPRGVPRVAGELPGNQGIGVLGGDAEHMERQKNTTNGKIVLLNWGLDNPVAIVILQIGK